MLNIDFFEVDVLLPATALTSTVTKYRFILFDSISPHFVSHTYQLPHLTTYGFHILNPYGFVIVYVATWCFRDAVYTVIVGVTVTVTRLDNDGGRPISLR